MNIFGLSRWGYQKTNPAETSKIFDNNAPSQVLIIILYKDKAVA
jgi:hypothetical protein